MKVYPIPKPVKKPKKKRTKDKSYQDYIRAQSCLICGHPDTVHHHESLSGGSMGSKCPDNESLPLCHEHHHERHSMGRDTFFKKYGINYYLAVLRYQEAYSK